MVWYIYCIQNRIGIIYTGITIDINRRIDQHNGILPGGAKATRNNRPWVLVYSESHEDRSSAQREEYRIKKLKRKDKLELIKYSDINK